MRSLLDRVCNNYILESKNDFKGNALAEYIRNDIPSEIYRITT